MLEFITPILSKRKKMKKKEQKENEPLKQISPLSFSVHASFQQFLLELFVDEISYFCLQSPLLFVKIPKRQDSMDSMKIFARCNELDLIVRGH